ncbi:MAG: hypothetical protein ABSE89_11640 [Sedimentisphaerales bacterium]
MFKKVLVSICAIFLSLILAGSAAALDIVWTDNNGIGDGLWTTKTNWSPAWVPDINYQDKAKINALPGPLINTGMSVGCTYLAVSDGVPGNLHMTGGILTVAPKPGTSDSWAIVAYGAYDIGIFTIDNGTITTSDRVYIGFKGQGTLNMNGGTFNIGGMFGIGYNDASTTTGKGYVYLNSGTITAADFQMRYPTGMFGLLDITGGTLIINGNKTTLINSYIASGWITAYGGAGDVLVDYNITNPGKTTVRGFLDPRKAANPNPGNNTVKIAPDANLIWTAGSGVVSHNVYLGTTNPPTFIGNQTATTFDAGILDFNTTYYWRIDEVNGPNIVTGSLWKFTSATGQAENPDPASGTTNVALDKVLNWTAGYGAVSHDVYLGTDANSVAAAERLVGDLDGDGQVDYNDLLILTDYWLQNPVGSDPYADISDNNIVNLLDYTLLASNWMAQSGILFKGNTTATSYSYNDPCGFEPNTTYYWRIDEIKGQEKKKGNVWSFKTTAVNTLEGKVLCGYQGWFNTPTDGAGRGWVHWSKNSGSFIPSTVHVDMWPDMNDMNTSEKYEASDFYDGNSYYVFSSHNRDTVLRHFQWMQQYGIDGVYLQRFANEIKDQSSQSFYHRNDVLSYCKDGANMYGRIYSVMYDLSGLKAGETSYVIKDWKYLVDTKKVTRDPNDHAYAIHRGKPVVAVWGIGFNDGRKYTLAECLNLVNFLKNDPNYGGNTVMVGVPSYWRTLSNDCVNDPNVYTIILAADIVSPWSVGRYNYGGLSGYVDQVWVQDVNWCSSNGKDYLPVIWPGSSHHNSSSSNPLNQFPRYGGQFLWNQVSSTVSAAHVNMLYVAMFDEADEGTAIIKFTNNPPRPGGVDMFVTPSFDGYPLPSDEYLWLTGEAGRALRGEMNPVPLIRPAR